jgi:DNA repair protein RecN (Recombination protein N)
VEDQAMLDLLQEWGIECDDELVITREVFVNGRNRCRINGSLVSVSQLAELGPHLAEIVGQHDSQSLLDSTRHLALLDAFGGQELSIELARLRDRYEAWTTLQAELDRIAGDERERNRRIDLLRFQVMEIAGAKLKLGEEESLLAERKRLANLHRLREAVELTYGLLNESLGQGDSVIRQLNVAQAELAKASAMDSQLAPLTEMFAEAVTQIEELNRELWTYLDGCESDPGRLDEVETRLSAIDSLKRKYGDSIAEILAFADAAQAELAFLESSSERCQELEKELAEAWEAWLRQAQKVSALRKRIARNLERRIEEQLADLNMANTRFVVAFEANGAEDQRRPARDGLEKVQFMIAPNVGEELRPLSRIASGGELSRLLLAIKVILAEAEAVPTMVFDEIDTGIGGHTAGKVGEKLRALSATCQVLCVTHLPVIASYGAHHYSVTKASLGERTAVSARELSDDERVSELIRMFGGSGETESATYAHAKELLAKSCGI